MRDEAGIRVYHLSMATFIEHIVKLTDHRDRDLLELTLSKALIDLLPLGRIVIAHVMREDGEKMELQINLNQSILIQMMNLEIWLKRSITILKRLKKL